MYQIYDSFVIGGATAEITKQNIECVSEWIGKRETKISSKIMLALWYLIRFPNSLV